MTDHKLQRFCNGGGEAEFKLRPPSGRFAFCATCPCTQGWPLPFIQFFCDHVSCVRLAMTFIGKYGVHAVFLAGLSPYIHTVICGAGIRLWPTLLMCQFAFLSARAYTQQHAAVFFDLSCRFYPPCAFGQPHYRRMLEPHLPHSILHHALVVLPLQLHLPSVLQTSYRPFLPPSSAYKVYKKRPSVKKCDC